MSTVNKQLYRFGDFSLNVGEGTLWRDGRPVALTPKAIETLIALVRRHGEVISKDELLRAVWPDTSVEENNLTQHISLLRKALGEGADGTPYIETVPKRGYRFAAQVIEPREFEPIVRTSPPSRTWRTGIAVAAGLLFVAALIPLSRNFGGNPASSRTSRRSIAVLPFRNLSGKTEDGWLSTALSEMLAGELAAAKGVRTANPEEIARIRRELNAGDAQPPTQQVLRALRANLGVDLALVGSFATLDDGPARNLRLDLRMVDTATCESVATANRLGPYSGLFDMLSQTGALLRADLGQGELSSSDMHLLKATRPSTFEAERLYSEGLEKLRSLDAVSAQPLLERAVSAAPDFAPAHSALSESWRVLGYTGKARDEAKKAFDLAGALPREQFLSIEAQYLVLASEWDRATDIYNSLWMVFPDNPEYGLRLIEVQTAAGRPAKALSTLAELRRRFPNFGSDPRIALAAAAVMEGSGNFKNELTSAMLAVQSAESRGSRLMAANALLRECWALNKLGENQRAIEAARRAEQSFAALRDEDGRARSLKNIADVLDDQGDHRGARQVYEQALAIFRAIGHDGAVATTLNNQAYAVKDLGDLPGARRLFEQSLGLSRKLGDESREAQALNGLAIVYWRQGDLVGAEKMYSDAFAIYSKRQDKARTATVLGNLAIVLQDQGKLEAARAKFEESLQVLRDIGDKQGIARTLGNIGELLLKQGQPNLSKAKFLEQMHLARDMADDKQRAYAMFGLGETLLAQGNLQESRARHEEALALRIKMGENILAAESRLALARVALAGQDASVALPKALAAEDELKKAGEKDEALAAEAIRAECLIVENKPADFKPLAVRLQNRVEQIQDIDLRLGVLLALSKIEQRLGNRQAAYKQLERVSEESARYGYVQHGFAARILLASKDLNTEKGRSQLIAVEQEARSRGLNLLALQAAATKANTEQIPTTR